MSPKEQADQVFEAIKKYIAAEVRRDVFVAVQKSQKTDVDFLEIMEGLVRRVAALEKRL